MRKSEEGGIVLKLDFAKAYDNIDWSLILVGSTGRNGVWDKVGEMDGGMCDYDKSSGVRKWFPQGFFSILRKGFIKGILFPRYSSTFASMVSHVC